MISLLDLLSIAIVWLSLLIKFQLPFLSTSKSSIIYLKQKAPFILFFAWGLFILEKLLFDSYPISELTIILLVIPSILMIYFRYFVLYSKIYPKLSKIEELDKNFYDLVKKESDVAILQFFNKKSKKKIVHAYPIILLRVGDIIYNIDKTLPSYSLTYCVLCNTVHAFHLPVIDGKLIEITSNNGTVLNGNKILANSSSTLVWQQFTGYGLNRKSKNNPLVELQVNRFKWDQALEYFPDARVFYGKQKLFSKLFFNTLNTLVKRYQNFSFSFRKTDPRLQRKQLLFGIEENGLAKAYPLDLFNAEERFLLTDKIGELKYTILFNKGTVFAFKETGLTLKDNELHKSDNTWSIFGQSLTNGQDLKKIHVTENAYWYMWSKFFPHTEIYIRST